MKVAVAPNGVRFYYSGKIPCPHAFSTRIGGVSQSPETASLNLGVDRGDPLAVVQENLERFGAAVGFCAEHVISVPQVHSDHLRYVSKENRGEGFFTASKESCDGYYTDQQGIVLGIKTADCVPILFYGTDEKGKAHIAAVHAGWRGTVLGIAAKAVGCLSKKGVNPNKIAVAIGPCCYEVKEDFYGEVLRKCGTEIVEQCMTQISRTQWRADIRKINRILLIRAGISEENMDICNTCTCCHPKEFFSHRYSCVSNFHRGTMLSVITLDTPE